MKLQFRLTLLFLLLIGVPLVFLSVLSVQSAQERIVRQAFLRLDAAASIQEQRVGDAIDRYLEQLRLIASRTQLRREMHVARFGSGGDFENVQRILLDAQSSIRGVREVSVMDISGAIVASTNIETVGSSQSNAPYWEEAQRQFFLYDVVQNRNNLTEVVLVGPLVFQDELVGVLEVRATAALLSRITRDSTGLGETGEVLLAKRTESGDALFLNPLRFDGEAALRRIVRREKTSTPINVALSGREETLLGESTVDYRGVHVLAVTRYIDALGWGLVTKIDRDEIFSVIVSFQRALIIITTLILVFAGFIAWITSRSIFLPILALTKHAQRLSGGELDVTFPLSVVRTKDEVLDLARAFQVMTGRLKQVYDSLERKVASRTRELEEQVTLFEEQNKALEASKQATLNVMEDLNEEKIALAESKVRDEAILASMGDGLVVTDRERTIIKINKVVEHLTGFSSSELIGKKWPEVLARGRVSGSVVGGKNNPLKESALPIVQAIKQARQVIMTDLSYLRRDGTFFPVAITASPLEVDGRVTGAVLVFRDISKEREIDKAKTEFVSLASHQLRTPLSTVNWYAEMLISGDAGKLTKEQKQYLEEIYTGNQRMVALVNALLDVSRIELGTFSVEPVETDVTELVRETVKELQPKISQKELRVTEKYNDISPVLVDPKLIGIVFQNLISNAVKYTPDKGSIAISLAKQDDTLLFTVADTGIGIPKNQQDKIFTKLFRADNVQQSDTTGTGLGLYLLKAIVENSGGKVWFESEQNKGTTFYVSFPLSGMRAKKGSRRLGD